MNILFTGDWQASITNLDRCQLIVDQICAGFKAKKGPKYFVHLGDVKETFNPVDQRVTNFIIDAFRRIGRCCDGMYAIRGNHDSITTQDGVPSIMPLLKELGCLVADYGTLMCQLPFADAGCVELYLVPYFRSHTKQKEEFRVASGILAVTSQLSNPAILAFHNEVKGCQRTAYTLGEGDLTYSDTQANKYNLAISGHIHRPHEYIPSVGGSSIYYVGSPFCCDWGEANERKMFLWVFPSKNKRNLWTQEEPSCVPGWYDPNVPGFKDQKDWTNTHVRISVPVSNTGTDIMCKAEEQCKRAYPGAILHLIPDYQTSTKPEGVPDASKNVSSLLDNYLELHALPNFIEAAQVKAYIQKHLTFTELSGIQSLRFGRCYSENVLPFEKVEFDFDRTGITLLTGNNRDWNGKSNGGGKSSLVTLPFIAMFGRTFKNQTHDGWASQNTNLTATVCQKVTLSDDRVLLFERTRRPAGFRVFLDNSEISLGDTNQTQTLTEKITNLNWSVLTNAVYIGQREIGSVFGTDKERKELFGRLLGLERFTQAHDSIKKDLTRVGDCAQTALGDFEYVGMQLQAAQTAWSNLKAMLKEHKKPNPKELPALRTQIQTIEVRISKRATNKMAMQGLGANQKAFESLLFESTALEARNELLEKQIVDAVGIAAVCPTCGSEPDHVRIATRVNEWREQMEKNNARIAALEKEQAKNREERNVAFKKFHENDRLNLEDRKTQARLEKELALLEEQTKVREQLIRRVEEHTNEIVRLERLKNVSELAVQYANEEVEFLKLCAGIVGRDGLPALLCTTIAPQLNHAAQHYSSIFSEGEISLEFTATQDLDVEIRNLHGGKNMKDQSAGEMRMAGIIAAFAFREVLVPHNILILDEPTEGLDVANAVAFAHGLNQVAATFKHVIVISHNDNLLSVLKPDRHIEVIKENGVSRIIEV